MVAIGRTLDRHICARLTAVSSVRTAVAGEVRISGGDSGVRTGVLYNPKAGGGISASTVFRQLRTFCMGEELLVTEPETCDLGEPVRSIAPPTGDGSYFGQIAARVKALVGAGAEQLICIGGDGTATYILTALYQIGVTLPVLGIASGTANVGPVVSAALDQLTGHRLSDCKEISCDGLAAYMDGRFVSLAFNDLVIGDTFLATVGGKTCNVSVHELLQNGKLVPKSPEKDLISADFLVELNGTPVIPAVGSIQQIVLSSAAMESHYGRAIYGPLGKCDWGDKKGVIALCDHIAVSYEENDAGTGRFSTMQYLLFGPDDHVVLRGFSPKACMICDGNPYLLDSEDIEVRYLKNLVRVLKI